MVTFANGKTFALLNIHGGIIVYQGAKRNMLDFRISPDSSTLDELNTLIKNSDATSEITYTTSARTDIVSGYTVPLGVGRIYNEDGTSELYIKLAQKSDLELKVAQLEAAVAALTS